MQPIEPTGWILDAGLSSANNRKSSFLLWRVCWGPEFNCHFKIVQPQVNEVWTSQFTSISPIIQLVSGHCENVNGPSFKMSVQYSLANFSWTLPNSLHFLGVPHLMNFQGKKFIPKCCNSWCARKVTPSEPPEKIVNVQIWCFQWTAVKSRISILAAGVWGEAKCEREGVKKQG